MSTLVAALVAAASGLLGVVAGAAAAFHRFKKERAFDVRLQWYLEAVRLLHDAATNIDTALRLHRGDQGIPETLEDLATATQGALDSMKRAADHLHGGLLLADRESLEALRDAIAQVGVVSGLARGSPDERWPPLITMYRLTADKVARQGRRHLGLGSLPASIRTAAPAASTKELEG